MNGYLPITNIAICSVQLARERAAETGEVIEGLCVLGDCFPSMPIKAALMVLNPAAIVEYSEDGNTVTGVSLPQSIFNKDQL